MGVVAVLALAFATGLLEPTAGEPRSAKASSFVIVGAVTMSKELVPDGAALIPITFDARFIIRVKVERVVSGSAPWKAGSEQLFVIHSPVRMFGRHDIKGERFRFTFETDPQPASKEDCRYCVTGVKREGATGV